MTTWDRPVRPILVDGELPPGWARVFEAVVIPALLLLILLGVTALVIRFRSGSWEERQQINWVVLGSSYLLLSGVVVAALPDLLPPLMEELLSIAGFLTVPIAIAILRHRLYDIDSIINRTLVYGGLTAVLALVYFGGVVGVGGVVREATSQHDNSLVIAGTTLLIAALVRPARARIQGFIDKCFYRRKYDAAKTVETFSARLRDQVDLDTIGTDLLTVVRDTMQPANASLWLRH
jgi:hypothetical protein